MKKGHITISIIIPYAFNHDLLVRTLNSIANQNFKNWECLVINDLSEPPFNKHIEGFEKDSRFKFFNRPKKLRKGANSCRNYGFQLSKGNFIQWFDADDLMHPEMLQEKVNKLDNTKAEFVVCEGLCFKKSTDKIQGKWDLLESDYPLLDHAMGKINFQTNAPMFRRSFLEGKNLWNTGLQRKQDYEFFSRLLSYNPEYKIIRKPLFYYRIHGKSINGKNQYSSIYSMIKADQLVFQNIKTEAKKQERFPEIQKHFFRKTLSRVKTASEIKSYRACFLGFFSLIKIIDLNYIKNYFLAED